MSSGKRGGGPVSPACLVLPRAGRGGGRPVRIGPPNRLPLERPVPLCRSLRALGRDLPLSAPLFSTVNGDGNGAHLSGETQGKTSPSSCCRHSSFGGPLLVEGQSQQEDIPQRHTTLPSWSFRPGREPAVNTWLLRVPGSEGTSLGGRQGRTRPGVGVRVYPGKKERALG